MEYSLTPMKSDKQFKRAVELCAGHIVRLERAATGGVSVRIKNPATREELTLPLSDAVKLLSAPRQPSS